MAIGDDSHDEFTDLYRVHADRVYGYLCARLGRPDVAEDLTAQVFLEAWRQRDRVVIDPDVGWAPWLFGVARNLARESARQQARVQVVDPGADLAVWGVVPDTAGVHADQEERNQQVAAALRATRALGQADREVIELCVIGALTPAQAATTLDQPASTVRSRLTRARRRLRNLTDELLCIQQEEAS